MFAESLIVNSSPDPHYFAEKREKKKEEFN